jgi:glycerol uptake facilitator-like aquaporin
LILTFGPISGAHFNPAVTLVDTIEGGLPWSDAVSYIVARCVGAISGTIAAHHFFLPTCAKRSPSTIQRVRCNLWSVVCHLGLFPLTSGSTAVRGWLIHHCRLLVHCIYLICKPSSDDCAVPQ